MKSTLRKVAVAGLVCAAIGAGVTVDKVVTAPDPNVVQGKTLTVYSSLPLQGAQAVSTSSVLNGMKLALAQAGGRAGEYKVELKSLDDTTTALGAYDPGQCQSDANAAAANPTTIAYLGEYNSGCTENSLPILNQAGIAMVSPGNTYVGLTIAAPGSAAGEPGKYYPTGQRTYLRVVPNDTVQARADVDAMKAAGCTVVAEANDGTPYGAGIATVVKLDGQTAGLNVVSDTGVDPNAATYAPYATTVKAQGATCFYFGGTVATGGVKIFEAVNAAIPTAKLFGPDGMSSTALTNPAQGGVPLAMDPLIETTNSSADITAYPGGPAFLAAYHAAYGADAPDPTSIFGYESMKLVLDTIAKLGPQGNVRSAVISALMSTKDRQSAVGTYSINANGDTTLSQIGVYGASNGQLVFERTVG